MLVGGEAGICCKGVGDAGASDDAWRLLDAGPKSLWTLRRSSDAWASGATVSEEVAVAVEFGGLWKRDRRRICGSNAAVLGGLKRLTSPSVCRKLSITGRKRKNGAYHGPAPFIQHGRGERKLLSIRPNVGVPTISRVCVFFFKKQTVARNGPFILEKKVISQWSLRGNGAHITLFIILITPWIVAFIIIFTVWGITLYKY